MAGLRALRVALASCLSCFLAGCAQKPVVECTASIAMTVKDSCEKGLWDLPLDVKLDDQVIGTIGIDRARFDFKYNNRQHWIDVWAGKRQLTRDLLSCKLGEHHEYGLSLWHMGNVRVDGTVQAACEGRSCLTVERETVTPAKPFCHTEASFNHLAINTTQPPAHTCKAIIQRVVAENSCAPGLWDVPIQVKVSGHDVGSIEPGATSFGPFPYTEPDPWVSLYVGERWLAVRAGLSCDDDAQAPLTLRLLARHVEFVPRSDSTYCEGVDCLQSSYVKRDKYCSSEFELDTVDAPPGE